MRAVMVVALLLLSTLTVSLVALPASGQGELSVSGTVTDGSGAPMTGISVTAVNTTDPAMAYDTTTGTDGSYSLELPPGTYNISAAAQIFRANASYVNISVDSDVDGVDFTMTEILGTVTGHITNGTTTLAGARVTIANEERNYSVFSSAPLGAFVITDVHPGVYIAYAEREGYDRTYYPTPVTVVRGASVDMNFTLTEQPSRLLGKVTFNNAPLSGVRVTAVGDDMSERVVQTDGEGIYRFDTIPAGHYTLTFTRSGYDSVEVSVNLAPLKDNVKDAQMKRAAVQGGEGFFPGYDLSHSLMIIGLALSLITIVAALFIRYRVRRRPDLLSEEEEKSE